MQKGIAIMKHLLLGTGIFLAGLLAFAAGTAQAAADEPAPAFKPAAARYQETRGDGDGHRHGSEWVFIRSGAQVELGRGGYVELWERDERGEISWQRVFHDERKLISYTPGELRTERRAPSWEVLNSIIDERLLGSLRPVGATRYLGHAATRYRGEVDGERIEVLWLDAERLPATVSRRDKTHSYQLRLRELHPAPAPGWPRADLARAADYEYIDGSDLGDREYEPFVRKVLAMDEAHGAGGHAH
jgi:hypothetical protein